MDVFDLVVKISLDSSDYERGLAKMRSGLGGPGGIGSSLEKVVTKASAVGHVIGDVFEKAAGVITQSMGSAVSRVDTLNSYSKVMTSLGYTADEADASMQKLSDGIQGLPTTLPGIVTMQQQFAALTGSMDSATDLTLALNDAVVSGGQSTEVANSALYQWYQIIANGTPDLQSWRIINSAMPAQLNAIAEECVGAGAKSQDLFNAWKKGTVTTDQVMDAVKKLDKEGGSGFQSFAEQAQGASGGIATSMQNVKTKVSTVVANVIQSVMDGGLDIAGILDQLKGSIGEVGEKAVELAGKIDWAAVSDAVSAAIDGIAQAIMSIDWETVITTAITLFQALGDVVGWIVSTVGPPLATGIQTVITFLSDFVSDIQETCGPAFEALGGAITSLVTAFGDLFTGSSDASDGIDLAQTAADVLSGFIQTAADAVNFLADNLDTIVPIVAGVTAAFVAFKTAMAITSAITAVQEALTKFKEAQEATTVAQALLNAVMNANPFVLIITIIAGVVAALVTLWNTNDDFREGVISAWEAIKEFFAPIGDFFGGVFDAIGGFFSGFADKVSGFAESVGGFFSDIKDKASTAFEDVKTKVGDAWDNITTKTSETWDAVKGKIEENGGGIQGVLATAVEGYQTTWQQGFDAIDNLTGGKLSEIGESISQFFSDLPGKLSEFFSDLPGKLGYALGTLIGTIINFGSEVVDWIATNVPLFIENVITFVSELPGKIWGFLTDVITNIITWGADMGQKALEAGQQFIDNIVSFFTQLPGKLWELLTLAISNVANFVSDLALKATSAGQQFLDNVVSFFTKLPGKVKQKLDDTIEKARNFVTDLGQKGIDAAADFFKNIVDGLASLPDEMLKIGKSIVDGIWNGIQDAAATFTQNVNNFFSGIVQGVKDTLGIHSPSRVFAEIGGYMMSGLSQGWDRGMASFSAGVESDLASISGTASRWADGLNWTFQGSGAAFSGAGMAQAASGYGQVSQTVNIYSPTALDPSEAARQTRNATRRLLLSIRGA